MTTSPSHTLPKVALIATGGTIAGVAPTPLEQISYQAGVLGHADRNPGHDSAAVRPAFRPAFQTLVYPRGRAAGWLRPRRHWLDARLLGHFCGHRSQRRGRGAVSP